MINMINDLRKLKYIRNPCNKCLIQPMCKRTCDKYKIHMDSQTTMIAFISSAIITLLIFLGCYIFA